MMKQQAKGDAPGGIEKQIEVLLANQYTPQLIRHVQILWRSLNDAKVKTYLKIGTTGTGGMGLNIPYTHSEDKPSRVLLAKSAMAGAHSMLLFLLGRTAPDTDEEKLWGGDRNIKQRPTIIKEIKPAAAIAWKKIDFGPVKRRGQLIPLFDHSPEEALDFNSSLKDSKTPWKEIKDGDGPSYLKAPFIDTGENGIFSKGEFEAITDEGQMEFITPEEIAMDVEQEIVGGNSGSDIVSALDSTVLGPTYRAGFLRARALERLRLLEKEHNIPSIAFENLGPDTTGPKITQTVEVGTTLPTATATISSGSVNAINITYGGAGYTSAPNITLTGNARAHAEITDGVVTNIVIDDAGSGYSSAPTVTFENPPNFEANPDKDDPHRFIEEFDQSFE